MIGALSVLFLLGFETLVDLLEAGHGRQQFPLLLLFLSYLSVVCLLALHQITFFHFSVQFLLNFIFVYVESQFGLLRIDFTIFDLASVSILAQVALVGRKPLLRGFLINRVSELINFIVKLLLIEILRLFLFQNWLLLHLYSCA